jgi:hypothetical protein
MFILLALLISSCSKKEKVSEVKKDSVSPIVQATDPSLTYDYTARSVRNNVTWSDNDSIWNILEKGFTLKAGSIVETGTRSLANLDGSLGDMVVIGEKSKVRLTIEELAQYIHPDGNVFRGMEILKGRVSFSIKKLAGGFWVKTPSAMVKVKGTTFVVEYSPVSKVTNVKVLEGKVVVEDMQANKLSSDTINSGEKLQNIGDAKKSVKEKLNRNEIENLLNEEGMETIKEKILPLISFPSKEELKQTHARISSDMYEKETKPIVTETKGINEPTGNLETEKEKSQTAMDSVRTVYTNEKQTSKQNFEEQKQTVEQDMTNKKTEAQKELDTERENQKKLMKTEKIREDSSGRDMFEEMRRKKGQ